MKTGLKAKLARMELTIGGWIMLGHPGVAEIMARSGLDWVIIDLEHSAITTQQAEDLIRAIDNGGSAPMVRLTSNDENLIKRMLDSGAVGFICPMVKTAEEAKRLVDATYYPPRGTRGVGLTRAHKYGADFDGYMKWLENEAVIITQIEHIDAVNNIDEILSVPGIDGYILGPYDLSASMGMPGKFDHPDVVAAIARVRDAGKRLNKPGGIHVVEPDQKRLKDAVDQGMTFIAYSIDTRIIDSAYRAGIASVKGEKK